MEIRGEKSIILEGALILVSCFGKIFIKKEDYQKLMSAPADPPLCTTTDASPFDTTGADKENFAPGLARVLDVPGHNHI